jgi:hypothetical protein
VRWDRGLRGFSITDLTAKCFLLVSVKNSPPKPDKPEPNRLN